MFNSNDFKRQVKEWIKANPTAGMNQLQDFCETIIPAHEYASHSWIIDQTKLWYGHILAHREMEYSMAEEDGLV